MCVLIGHTFCESLVKICANKRKCRPFLGYFFSVVVYLTFNKYSRPLHKLERGHRRRRWQHTATADRIPELPTDRHFSELSEMCLYIVHFGLEPFFDNRKKNVYIGLL